MVGATHNACTVTEFELLFHEIWSITNLLNFFTTHDLMNHTECHLKHALSSTRRNMFNQNVVKVTLPGFTDQPQKTPATILKEKKDL